MKERRRVREKKTAALSSKGISIIKGRGGEIQPRLFDPEKMKKKKKKRHAN